MHFNKFNEDVCKNHVKPQETGPQNHPIIHAKQKVKEVDFSVYFQISQLEKDESRTEQQQGVVT